MSAHKPTQSPPTVEELLAQLDLVSRYAGQMNQVKRFTLDTETGLPETVAMHTLRLALSVVVLLASAGAAWGTIGKAAVYALVHDLPEIKTGDVVTLGGLTPEQRADKAQREEAADQKPDQRREEELQADDLVVLREDVSREKIGDRPRLSGRPPETGGRGLGERGRCGGKAHPAAVRCRRNGWLRHPLGRS